MLLERADCNFFLGRAALLVKSPEAAIPVERAQSTQSLSSAFHCAVSSRSRTMRPGFFSKDMSQAPEIRVTVQLASIAKSIPRSTPVASQIVDANRVIGFDFSSPSTGQGIQIHSHQAVATFFQLTSFRNFRLILEFSLRAAALAALHRRMSHESRPGRLPKSSTDSVYSNFQTQSLHMPTRSNRSESLLSSDSMPLARSPGRRGHASHPGSPSAVCQGTGGDTPPSIIRMRQIHSTLADSPGICS
jgi:hypothetical protein